MIDLARASLEHIDERLDRISLERESLLALRGAWERFLALGDAPPIEQPAAMAGEGASIAPGGEADGSRASASPIEQPAAGDSPPVPAPSAGAPGSARSGPRARRGTGRRAPAAAAVPRPSSPSGLVGTPTPASTTPPPVAPKAADPASIACQFCHRPFPARRMTSDFDEVMAGFDRVLRNEDGIRDQLVEAGLLVPIRPPRPPAYGGAAKAERLRGIHSQETAP